MSKNSKKKLVLPTTGTHPARSKKAQGNTRTGKVLACGPTEIKSTPPPKRPDRVKYPEDMRS